MKLKTLKLLMFFLTAGLFVSSKETADKKQSGCSLHCIKEKLCSAKAGNEEQTDIADYPFLLAPGSNVFFY
jgi:hypothetical protein